MKTYNILNLYSCLGGNRAKWDEAADSFGIDIKVTGVELDKDLARLYKERFPNDTVIVADAHEYLLNHHDEFDFIWSSPPCPTHSRARFARKSTTTAAYPDMTLYQEIIFLQKWFKGKYLVENVIPYYKPLIPATVRGRHLYWSNFDIPELLSNRKTSAMAGKSEMSKWNEFHDFDFSRYKGKQRKDKIARNLVDYEAGKTILEKVLSIEFKEELNVHPIFQQALMPFDIK